MKYLISLLVVCLGAGCATRKELAPKAVASVPGTSVPAKRMATVRTPEVVKSYSAGRYTDPSYPDEMHERHTVYRREQSPDWNYLPDPPPVLDASYADASGQLNAKQRAYAEALQEQNRAMQKRVEELERQTGQVPGLQREIDQLKKRIEEAPTPEPTTEDDVFSRIDPELPAWDQTDDRDFLFSQMRSNDEFAAHLAAAERRQISTVLPHLRRKEFALLAP